MEASFWASWLQISFQESFFASEEDLHLLLGILFTLYLEVQHAQDRCCLHVGPLIGTHIENSNNSRLPEGMCLGESAREEGSHKERSVDNLHAAPAEKAKHIRELACQASPTERQWSR